MARFKGVGYGQFKEELADAIIAVMEPIQERYYELLKSDKLDEILECNFDELRLDFTFESPEEVREIIGSLETRKGKYNPYAFENGVL